MPTGGMDIAKSDVSALQQIAKLIPTRVETCVFLLTSSSDIPSQRHSPEACVDMSVFYVH